MDGAWTNQNASYRPSELLRGPPSRRPSNASISEDHEEEADELELIEAALEEAGISRSQRWAPCEQQHMASNNATLERLSRSKVSVHSGCSFGPRRPSLRFDPG